MSRKSTPDRESPPGSDARRLAIEAMVRIESGGAFANIVLPSMLDDSSLSAEDRRFVTNLVYGATRMKRGCDHLADRFLLGDADDEVRAALRIGCYQLVHLGTPPHAAVAATVGAMQRRKRGVVNAVLRKVAEAEVSYPDDATRLSYPDWIHARLVAALGPEDAVAAMEAMNRPAPITVRDDGYIQDEASQHVVAAVAPDPGDLVVDLCAAPGGKATGLARLGARVVAADRRSSRVRLVAANVARLESGGEGRANRTGDAGVSDVGEEPRSGTGATVPLVADGRRPPFPDGVADRVLVDAPCSGFGSFRRRPDSRWRIDEDGPERLADLQAVLVRAGLALLKPGGELTYAVCTFGSREGREVVERAVADVSGAELLDPPGAPWTERDGMAVLLPTETDGMMLARLRRSG